MTTALLILLFALLVVLHRQIHGLRRDVHHVARSLHAVIRKENTQMNLTEELLAAISRNTTAVGSVIEYLKSLPAGTTVEEAIAHMNENSAALEGAIPANIIPA